MSPRLSMAISRLVSASARHAKLVLAGTLVVILLALLGTTRMRFSPSLVDMFGGGSPAAEAMERIANDYRTTDELLIVATTSSALDQSPIALEAFALKFQAAVESDPASAAMVSHIRFARDDSFDSYVRDVALPAGAFFLTDAGFDEFRARLTPDGMRVQFRRAEALIAAPGPAAGAIAEQVLRDPLRLAELVEGSVPVAAADAETGKPALSLSKDGRSLLIRVAGTRQVNDLDFSREFTDRIGTIAAMTAPPGVTIELGGGYAIAATTSRGIRSDTIKSILISVALLHVFFLIFYRSFLAPLLIVSVAGIGILSGFGVHGLISPDITPLTAVVAAMLAGLGIDYGIHYLSHYRVHRSHGLPSVDASRATALSAGVPIATNCITTIFGFASLWPSQVRMLSDFAVLGSLGLLGSLAAVLIVMPALLAVLDGPQRRSPQPPRFGNLVMGIEQRPRRCIAVACAALVGAIVGITVHGAVPSMESDLSVMHPRPNAPLEVTNRVPLSFSGFEESVPVEVQVADPKDLASRAHDAAKALQADLAGAGIVDVLGVHRLVPESSLARHRQQILADIDPDAVISTFDAEVARSAFEPSAFTEYRSLLRRFVTSPPPGVREVLAYPAVAEQVFPLGFTSANHPPDRTLLVVRLASPLSTRAARDGAVEGIRESLKSASGATLSGMSAVAYDLEHATRSDLPRSMAISLGLVVAWLWIVFRRPLDVLLALAPLLFAITVTLGAIAWGGLRLNAINGVALPLLDGIAVDAGVFLVASWRAHSGDRIELRSTAQSVLAASATTVTGFFALCFTTTPAIRSLGMLASIGVTASLVGALLLLLPMLLLRTSKSPRTARP